MLFLCYFCYMYNITMVYFPTYKYRWYKSEVCRVSFLLMIIFTCFNGVLKKLKYSVKSFCNILNYLKHANTLVCDIHPMLHILFSCVVWSANCYMWISTCKSSVVVFIYIVFECLFRCSWSCHHIWIMMGSLSCGIGRLRNGQLFLWCKWLVYTIPHFNRIHVIL